MKETTTWKKTLTLGVWLMTTKFCQDIHSFYERI